jgi:hypothetical protein
MNAGQVLGRVGATMKTRLDAIMAFALATAGSAFAQSPGGQEFYNYSQCVAGAAEKYAVLDQPITDIADVAMAACRTAYADLEHAVEAASNVAERQKLLADARESARNDALIKIADVKLNAR